MSNIAAVVSQALRKVQQEPDMDSGTKLYLTQTLKYLQESAERAAEFERLLQVIDHAIIVKGPVPRFHDDVMARHRKEWPTLWGAIDAARAGLAKLRKP